MDERQLLLNPAQPCTMAPIEGSLQMASVLAASSAKA